MAWTTLHWRSDVIGKQTSAEILLPDRGEPPFPVFYLLHGLSDDATMWLRRSRIEVYLAGLPLIVVMPDGYRGFYTNHDNGPAFARHMGDELPAVIERHFQARSGRAARAIGGLSMGGYGALRVGLAYADRFCSINSHSGAVGWGGKFGVEGYQDAARARGWDDEFVREMIRIFGESPRGSDHDLVSWAQKAQAAGNLPRILMDCGVDDYLLGDNRHLHRELTAANIAHTYLEHAGAHTWDYWDLHVKDALEFHAKSLGIERLT
ncbi:MAG TPA: alpha/beta hydrolase family protein [Opitutaceae bacterium]|nr:alpha/beta hydrolase family protein [Opitutaceae bacterium]